MLRRRIDKHLSNIAHQLNRKEIDDKPSASSRDGSPLMTLWCRKEEGFAQSQEPGTITQSPFPTRVKPTLFLSKYRTDLIISTLATCYQKTICSQSLNEASSAESFMFPLLVFWSFPEVFWTLARLLCIPDICG